MFINSDQLEAFYAVSETKSFTKGAELIYITQSAVTQRIKQLEKELDTKIFIRNNKNIELTENGKKLKDLCLNYIDLKNVFLDEINHKTYKGLNIVCGSNEAKIFVIPILNQLKNSEINISIKISDDKNYQLKLLNNHRVSLIFSELNFENKKVKSFKVSEIDYVLVTNYENKNIDKSEILNQKYIDFFTEDDITINHLRLITKQKKININRNLINDTNLILDWVLQDKSLYAVLPTCLINDYVINNKLKIVYPEITSKRPLYLTGNKEAFDKNITKTFYQKLKVKIKSVN